MTRESSNSKNYTICWYTILFCAGSWIQNNYMSLVNTKFWNKNFGIITLLVVNRNNHASMYERYQSLHSSIKLVLVSRNFIAFW